jgi:hypothetical protein
MRKMKEHPGREMRGLRVKVYPTPEQELGMLGMQRRLRRLWNWLVARSRDTADARDAFASKHGAGPKPIRPENDAGEEPWAAYKLAMREWRHKVKGVLAEHKGNPSLRYRHIGDYLKQFGVSHDYQLYPHLIDDEVPPPAHLQQALFKDYQAALSATQRGASPPTRRKRDEDMPLRVGSGICFRIGAYGTRPNMPQGRADWLNAQVKLPEVGWLGARLSSEQPLQPEEFWVEGIALRREADGWYAAIRQHVVPVPAPRGTGFCGIDVGLVHMFAAVGDDGTSVLADNTRRGSRRGHLRTPGGYVELIAERQAAKLPVSKLQARSARHIREVVRRELFPFTDRFEFVAVEKLESDIGFRNTPHLSFMRTIRSMLIQRYGCERVIDVDATDTSRICSMCGEKQPRSWSELPSRIGKCAACGHQEHSDLNAARNVLHNLLKIKAA